MNERSVFMTEYLVEIGNGSKARKKLSAVHVDSGKKKRGKYAAIMPRAFVSHHWPI